MEVYCAAQGSAAIPVAIGANAVVQGQLFPKGTVPPPPAASTAPVASPAAPGAPSSGELPWPPKPKPGNKTAGKDGFINFAGYKWITKDSNGGRVGPGNNIFSASGDNLWVDDWGLHLNIMPTAGCDRWISSEVWMDHSLGYGTYLVRMTSPVEFVDPDVTWSPFFLWDDTANDGNGFREVDFEMARWGNEGDPTSSQFVLRPLQAGGMVPGWRVRYETKADAVTVIQGDGKGSGECNQPGQDNFSGVAISKVTCAVRWFAGKLQWYCLNGHYTLDSLAKVSALTQFTHHAI
jgi:hypothetical protein